MVPAGRLVCDATGPDKLVQLVMLARTDAAAAAAAEEKIARRLPAMWKCSYRNGCNGEEQYRRSHLKQN